MAEDEPLKGNDSNEQEIGHNILYNYLVRLTEGFSKICGTEFTLIFIVFLFYRWLYLVYIWYELLFSTNNIYNIDGNTDIISCKITLYTVFIVIIFRSIFDSFLGI